MKITNTQVTPSVKPNLAAIQQDLKITIEALQKAYDNEKCYKEACSRTLREFSCLTKLQPYFISK